LGQASTVTLPTYDHLAITTSEEKRLAELERTGLLDTAPEPEFDRIVRLVTSALNVPMASVTLVDRDRQWFKASIGLRSRETPRSESFCSHAVALDTVLIVPDATLDERFLDNPSVVGLPNIRFYLGIPLRTAEGFTLGTLCAMDHVSRAPSDREVAILSGLAELVVEQIELRLAANVDGLTGAMQRRAFLAEAARDFARARRAGRPLGCLLLDADHFKDVNDSFGHAIGDAVLRNIATGCQLVLRESDYLGRLGGEEFCVMLPDAELTDAYAVAERIRQHVAGLRLTVGDNGLRVTVSIGVAAIAATDSSVTALIDRADRAMYEAKLGGRNRSRVAAG